MNSASVVMVRNEGVINGEYMGRVKVDRKSLARMIMQAYTRLRGA